MQHLKEKRQSGCGTKPYMYIQLPVFAIATLYLLNPNNKNLKQLLFKTLIMWLFMLFSKPVKKTIQGEGHIRKCLVLP